MATFETATIPENETPAVTSTDDGSEEGSRQAEANETEKECPSSDPNSATIDTEKGQTKQKVQPVPTGASLPSAVVIARRERSGLLSFLEIVPQVSNALDYSRSTKWFLTFVAAVVALPAPMGSSIFLPALDSAEHDLHISATTTNLSVALYMLMLAFGSLWWSAFSEIYGRRTIYLLSFALMTVFNILSAVSSSGAMLIVMRLLSGGSSASVQAIGPGTVADLWAPKERGQAMGIYFLGPLCGPLLAPIIGGALANRWGWRSTMWFMTVFSGVCLILCIFFLPETLASAKAKMDAKKDELRSGIKKSNKPTYYAHLVLRAFEAFFVVPFKVLYYLRFPAVLLTVFYASITFGILYILEISIQQTFRTAPYNFSSLLVGLLYIADSLGYLVAGFLGGRWMDRIMRREARKAGRIDDKGNPKFLPEDRMRENAMLGAFLYPAALLWYGWAADKGVYWFVPVLANFFFGVGAMLIMGISNTMLTEFMPGKATAGIALTVFVRMVLSCVGTIVATPIIDGIGNGWTFTIFGLVAAVSGMAIVLMRVRASRWRQHMDVALNKANA